jgi:hypothetical protein
VNQGSILSPRLFKKFLQDLNGALQARGVFLEDIMIKFLLWADDLVLFASDADALQQQLDHLEGYCNKWKIKINPSKTRIMIFDNVRGRKSVPHAPTFNLDGTEIDVTQDDVVYLGVSINSKHEDHFKTHLDYVTKKAQKSLFRIYSLCKNVGTLPPQLALHLFDTLVVSVLRYGSEVWYQPTASYDKRLEGMHLKFLRYVLGVRRSTPLAALYGETGRLPLALGFRCQAVKYASTLFARQDLPPNSPLYAARTNLADCIAIDRRCWLHNILAHSNDDTMRGIIEANLAFSAWRVAQYDASVEVWKNEVSNCAKLRTYTLFKQVFGLEMYLVHVRNVKHRKSLTRFRVSSHNLAIEKLRWNRTPVEQRLCIVCNTVEDEQHVLMSCSRYSDLRQCLFTRVVAEVQVSPLSIAECFTRVMANDSVNVCRNLASCVNAILTDHANIQNVAV